MKSLRFILAFPFFFLTLIFVALSIFIGGTIMEDVFLKSFNKEK